MTDFGKVLAGVAWLLICERQASYRRIKREFDLDYAALEDVRHELVRVKRCAFDLNGEFLVWAGYSALESTAEPDSGDPDLMPLTPWHDEAAASEAPAFAEAAMPESAPVADPAPAAAHAERRQITVMFCDLVGSTDLSGRLDPETLREVVRAYQEAAAASIGRFDGHIAQYLGDGLLVYFGYPAAHEDDAQRAVRTAWDIVSGLGALNADLQAEHGIQLAVRLGIHTGQVVVGEMGGGGRHEQLALGETPNIAARLEGLAGTNGIVVSSLTKELSGQAFEFEDLGARELKGVAGPFQVWRVSGLRNDDDQAADGEENNDNDAETPKLVGRDEEAGLLRRAWHNTRTEKQGQVVMLGGEPGIGKSALIDELRAQARRDGAARFTMRCSPYHSGSALYPVIQFLSRLVGWQQDDNAALRLAKLASALEGSEQPVAETLPLLAALMSLSLPSESYPPLAMTPQQQSRLTQDAIISIMLELAEAQPLLAVWEDLHWADHATLALIGALIEQVPTASVLMVLSSRPDFAPPWPSRSHITPITLNRLDRPHAQALVARIAGVKRLPDEVVDHIVTKADGVPLYVGELTKTILASNILRDAGDRFELTGPLSSLAIPDTLQESLMARLDRLPQVRELAQLGSVLGREFAYAMISGLSKVDDTVLQQHLGQLVDSDLLYQRGRPPRATYVFKHALILDAAYASLLRRTRQQAHLQVAQLLETQFPETVRTHPELLAHHFAEANAAEQAAAYLQLAGDRCLRMSANADAIHHLSKGLQIVRAMPDGKARDERELKLLLAIGPALIATKGYAAPDVEPAYRRALALCESLGDVPRQFSVLLGLSLFSFLRADLHVSHDLAERLVELATNQHEPGSDLAAERALGYALTLMGKLQEAQTRLDHVATVYDNKLHGSFALSRGGTDSGVGAMSLGCWGQFALGFPDQARERSARGLALARELRHPISEALALWVVAMAHLWRGELVEALACAQASEAFAREKGFVQYVAWSGLARGAVLLEQGAEADAIADLRKGLDTCHAIGTELINPLWTSYLASALARQGQPQQGLDLLAQALDQVKRNDERFSEAEVHRTRGRILIESDVADKHAMAERCFLQAITVARQQQARSWELRAASDLARLWHQQGQTQQARDLLAPVHAWFTEGLDTHDLVQARQLLAELRT